ncbi:MAG TPA: hypothetical protein VJS38_19440 [Phenylobacterium sp.]|uniref:hypothetical protein n=1 Tax=Phenylobacterium sp. TaxID=1871053 RepID=UPI002B497903|nr:hypothetical protein [Phenylobacterium sp.]HKR90348.1 hypothetical protein [Phenylobacterium sp.]
MKRLLAALAAGWLTASAAHAGEAVTTAGASGQTPPLAAAPAEPLSARTARPTDLDNLTPLAASRCAALVPADGKAHGEVWGGVGSHGYRDAGGAVTIPTGKCSSVSIAVDRVQGDFGGWRR